MTAWKILKFKFQQIESLLEHTWQHTVKPIELSFQVDKVLEKLWVVSLTRVTKNIKSQTGRAP